MFVFVGVACAIFGVPQLTGSSCSTSFAKEKLTGEAVRDIRGKFQHELLWIMLGFLWIYFLYIC